MRVFGNLFSSPPRSQTRPRVRHIRNIILFLKEKPLDRNPRVASEPKLTRDELEYQYIISVILYQPPHYFYFVYFFSYVSFFEPET